MYEAVHPAPHGESTVARHAATAAATGYDGVVVWERPDESTERQDVGAVSDEYGVDVVTGVEVVADDPSVVRGRVDALRDAYSVLAVRGGTEATNRVAVESPRVDVLTTPTRDGSAFDHVLATAAADNGVAVEFDVGPVLRSEGGTRVRALQGLRKVRDLVEHAGAPHVVSAGPRSHLQQRAPRELVAVGEAIGVGAETVRRGLETWGAIVDRNRHRQTDAVLATGVERGSPCDGPNEEGETE